MKKIEMSILQIIFFGFLKKLDGQKFKNMPLVQM